jgi:hypothetical protein
LTVIISKRLHSNCFIAARIPGKIIIDIMKNGLEFKNLELFKSKTGQRIIKEMKREEKFPSRDISLEESYRTVRSMFINGFSTMENKDKKIAKVLKIKNG